MPSRIIIAAMTRNRAIGKDNALIAHVPEDMKFFKERTMHSTVVMGRKTWDSLPAQYRPLVGRDNVVITRDPNFNAGHQDVIVRHSVEDTLNMLDSNIYYMGGQQIYEQALPYVNEVLLTVYDIEADGDAFFPELPVDEWRETSSCYRQSSAGFTLTFKSFQRNSSQL